MAETTISASSSREPSTDFTFDVHPDIDEYKDSYKTYLERKPFFETPESKYGKVMVSRIVVGALTFHPTSNPPRILLIQRSAIDSLPHLWEIPGGSVDENDQSILHGVARELKEETGLLPRVVGPMVGRGYIFQLGRRTACKLNFIVEVDSIPGTSEVNAVKVNLDPEEHQAFVWASEDDVRSGKVGDIDIPFTSKPQKDVILDAFEVREAELARIAKTAEKVIPPVASEGMICR